MGRGTIEHIGEVISTENGQVKVSVEATEACQGCASQSRCALGQVSSKRLIIIETNDAAKYNVGQTVSVVARTSTGLFAVVLCYIVPLFVLIGAISLGVFFGLGDALSAVVALAAVAVYYLLIWIFRNRIAKKVSFTITKS